MEGTNGNGTGGKGKIGRNGWRRKRAGKDMEMQERIKHTKPRNVYGTRNHGRRKGYNFKFRFIIFMMFA